MHGELHALREDLFVIEGQHATSVWHEMNVPHISMYRAGDTLYLLDTEVCSPQREAVRAAVRRLGGGFARVVLLNSHGHGCHVGSNAVLHHMAGAPCGGGFSPVCAFAISIVLVTRVTYRGSNVWSRCSHSRRAYRNNQGDPPMSRGPSTSRTSPNDRPSHAMVSHTGAVAMTATP
jgi:hypothetical protein